MVGVANKQNILVIKLGALGDMVMALQAFQSIRQHHENARISLLTTSLYRDIGEATGLFDKILVEDRKSWFNYLRWIQLGRTLRRSRYSRIYDLQNVHRTTALYFLLGGPNGPEWSGVAPGATYYLDRSLPKWDSTHAVEKLRIQLRIAGIFQFPPLSIDLIADHPNQRLGFLSEKDFVLIVPGSSQSNSGKRWHVSNFADVACNLAEQGLVPVLIGASGEGGQLSEIKRACPAAVNLCDRTDFRDLVWLGRRARLAVGNDTGPMHIFALTGAPSLTIFGPLSNPDRSAPRSPESGGISRVVRVDSLENLSTSTVLKALPYFDIRQVGSGIR